MLNLPEFNVILKEENEYYYRFTVEVKEPPYMCTQYGCVRFIHEGENIGDNVVFKPYQVKERTVSDISMHGKAVRIVKRHKRIHQQVNALPSVKVAILLLTNISFVPKK